jgi:thiopeptide-type bacteriocin biosynthesis protein
MYHGGDYGHAADRLGRWAEDLRRSGLVGDLTLDTYHPELGRYGTGAARLAAEELFAADSVAAVAQLAALARLRDRPAQALTAVSMVDLAAAMLGGRDEGMRWLVDHPDLAGHAPHDRATLRQALHLAESADAPAVTALAAAWERRREAAARYADCLTATGSHLQPSSVLASLLHLHHARVHGPDLAAENAVHRLARAVALAQTARRSITRETRR